MTSTWRVGDCNGTDDWLVVVIDAQEPAEMVDVGWLHVTSFVIKGAVSFTTGWLTALDGESQCFRPDGDGDWLVVASRVPHLDVEFCPAFDVLQGIQLLVFKGDRRVITFDGEISTVGETLAIAIHR